MNGSRKTAWSLATLLTTGLIVLGLFLTACQSGVTTEEVQGVVQAVDGGEVILKLDDGSKIRVEVEKQADDARNLIGDDVKVKIEVGDDKARAVEIERSSSRMPVPTAGLETMSEDFNFSGVVESIGADTWVIGGKTFKANAATVLDQGLAVGVVADVEFIMLSDGSLLATQIETQASDDPTVVVGGAPVEVGEDFSLTGVIGSISGTELMLGGKTFKIDANTILDQGLKAGVTAKVEFVPQAGGSLLALSVETDAPEVAEAKGKDFTAGGPIQAIDSGSVTVDGRKFVISSNTKLDSGLNQGVLVEVEFVFRPDGTMVAKKVETAGIDEGFNLYFAGPIQSMGATAWVIGGKTFQVNAATQLDQGLAVGINANVEFFANPDGSFTAVHIENTGFKFTGMVQAIAPGAYTIGGRVFTINVNTVIDQGLKVRKLAQVSFIIQADGSLLALQIKAPKTKVQGFTFKGVVQSMSAVSMVATGQTFEISPTTIIGAGVTVGAEVSVVFDIMPGNILAATSIQNAKAVQN